MIFSKIIIVVLFFMNFLVGSSSAQECITIQTANRDNIRIKANSGFLALKQSDADRFRIYSTSSLGLISEIHQEVPFDTDFELTENELVTVSASGSEVLFIDLESSNVVRRISLPDSVSGCGHAFASGDGWVAVSCLPSDSAPGVSARIFLLIGEEIEEVQPPQVRAGQHIFGYSLNGHANMLLIGSPADFLAWESGPMPESGVWAFDLSNRTFEFFKGDAGSSSASGASVASGDSFVATSTRGRQGVDRTTVFTQSGLKAVVDIGGHVSASGEFLSIVQTSSEDEERLASVHLYRVRSNSLENTSIIENASAAIISGNLLFYMTSLRDENAICKLEV